MEENILDYLGGLDVIIEVLKRGRQDSQRKKRRCDKEAEVEVMSSWRSGQEPGIAGGFSKLQKARKQILPSEIPEGTSPTDTLTLACCY